MKHRCHLLMGSTLFGLLVHSTSSLAQMTNLCNGCNMRIDAHGVCRDVYNGAGAAIMIPWNSAGEWASFYNNSPGGVSIAGCAPPPPPPPTDGVWVFAGYGLSYGYCSMAHMAGSACNPVGYNCSFLHAGAWHDVNCVAGTPWYTPPPPPSYRWYPIHSGGDNALGCGYTTCSTYGAIENAECTASQYGTLCEITVWGGDGGTGCTHLQCY